MKIAINADTRKVLSWTGETIEALAMTRRDAFPVEVKFIQGAKYVELPVGAVGVLALKSRGVWGDVVRADGGSWVKAGEGRDAVYTFFLALDTVALGALFSGEPNNVELAMEISWSYTLGTLAVRETAVAVDVNVANDYIR